MSADVGITLATLAHGYFKQAMWEIKHKPFFGDPDPYERARLNARAGLAMLDAATRLIA